MFKQFQFQDVTQLNPMVFEVGSEDPKVAQTIILSWSASGNFLENATVIVLTPVV
jgi:hypothetical protein